MNPKPLEHLNKTPEEIDKIEAEEAEIEEEWAPPGGWPEVSDRAKKVIDSLRKHPGLLREVALHFEHGWPTAELIEPWTVGNHQGVPALARLTYQVLINENDDKHPVALVLPLMGDGFDGSQWVASVHDPEEPKKLLRRRVCDGIDAAIAWCDNALTEHDSNLVLAPLNDKTADKLRSDFNDLVNTFNNAIRERQETEKALLAEIKRLKDKDTVTEAELNRLKKALRAAGVTECQIDDVTGDISVEEDEVPF